MPSKIGNILCTFTGMTIKGGKTTLQFELSPEFRGYTGQLTDMTGSFVYLDVIADQTNIYDELEY